MIKRSKKWTESTIAIKPKEEILEHKKSTVIKPIENGQNMLIREANTIKDITTIDQAIEITGR